MKTKRIKCTVNGKLKELEVDIRDSLLDMVRNNFGLTGTKMGCEVGECGACTVMVNGEPVDSCIYLAAWADGKDIMTVEGIANGGELSEIQQSFVDEGAVQCGFCIPGFIVTGTYLDKNGEPLEKDELKRALSGHLCRCTGYSKVEKAVDKVVNKK